MTEELEQQDAELTDNVSGDEVTDVPADAPIDTPQENSADADTTDAAPTEWPQDITVESVIEAILFATDEPLSIDRLVNIAQFNGGAKQIRKCIETLNQQYVETKRSFRIEEIAGGFQMMTLPEYNNWLKNMLKQRSDNKLSPAALETLAIISYKQPIIRADIEAIRGVACGEIVRTLMYKGLVKIVGKAEILGRPMLYGTTKKFLQVFGLSDIKDLPKAEDLKQPQQ
ncbi:MAG: SMC-Scp complex subunit ScpB [Planctomycetaceae bacterium]|nr:SMC-Scp complex subunit ScpB [Planctomycetaceae bacterium]